MRSTLDYSIVVAVPLDFDEETFDDLDERVTSDPSIRCPSVSASPSEMRVRASLEASSVLEACTRLCDALSYLGQADVQEVVRYDEMEQSR